jgi:hypothetical protein
MVTALASPANAYSYRYYSVGYDSLQFGTYTGIYTYHNFLGVTVSPGTDCRNPYANSANPIFYTQWVSISGATDQIEMGFGQQCEAFSYVFTGYRQGGTWHTLDIWEAAPDVNGHYFDIHRLNTQWQFWYDCCQLPWSLNWGVLGNWVGVGIESADINIVVPNHWFQTLNYTKNEGPWTGWSGNDQLVDPPWMCGRWLAAPVRWSAAQNTSC